MDREYLNQEGHDDSIIFNTSKKKVCDDKSFGKNVCDINVINNRPIAHKITGDPFTDDEVKNKLINRFELDGNKIKCKKKHTESLPSIIVNDKFHLGCKNGLIEPLIVQREGKKPMNINEFLKGFHFTVGQKINA